MRRSTTCTAAAFRIAATVFLRWSLDIKMPRLTAQRGARSARMKIPAYAGRDPVILAQETDLARSWDLGVNAYVVKPVPTSSSKRCARSASSGPS